MVASKTKRILVAEDEKAYSRALILKLQNAGFEAENVMNGEEALDALSKKDYDLFICDLIMPKMNGYTTMEEMKKRGYKVPIVALSNLGIIPKYRGLI